MGNILLAPGEPAIKVQNAVQRFGKQTVLDHVSLEVEQGAILGLLGPSGCGKTTLVNLLVGITVPIGGKVEVLGEQAPYKNARYSLGFMPQDEALYEDITAAENLAFFGAMYGLDKEQIKIESARALELASLEDQGKKLVAKFSTGMKRRLSLAIALLHSPQLLVLDEPTVGLDPEQRIKLWNNFRTLAQDGTTFLITTHVMDEANNCDRIAMLRDGHIIATGTPQELIEQTHTTTLEEAFLAFGKTYDSVVQPTSEKEALDA
ncbi:MAG: ABC transporter ATP-binding protein [Actinobacteria bacterium]|nr:ABC transporter ATP-binding protein [Actinomycetota bacterium]